MFHVDIENQKSLSDDQLKELESMWRRCAARIILSTTLAGSGHPGGSLSSLHTLLLLYAVIKHRPDEPFWAARDRIVISIGHISPAVYSVLSEFGYISEEQFLTEFRHAGSSFAGHVEQGVRGVEWNTGNLGQGLSVGTGIRLSQELYGFSNKTLNKTIVIMGDGEQQKGQIAEARRFAAKYRQAGLIGIVDRNHLQIGGSTEDVMSVRVREEYSAAGWNVLYVPDGHDFQGIFKALRRAWLHEDLDPDRPSVLVIRTVMGRGVSFMENRAEYHGSTLSKDDAKKALSELGFSPAILDEWVERRKRHKIITHDSGFRAVNWPEIDSGVPIVYAAGEKNDCRSACGAALKELAVVNNLPGAVPKVIGFSCDLESSVKMSGFRAVSPNAFFEAGIQEHHAAACAGALSREGFSVFFSTFGVFAVAETYNQHRLNDLNETHLKIVATHVGLDVGEDGPTHQSIDYIGLINNLLGFSIFMPADANQTDRIIRYVATHPGNVFVGMGRSKLPIITDEAGAPFFGKDYVFQPGKADWLRTGDKATFITYGSMVTEVLKARDILAEDGLRVGVMNMSSLKPIDRDAIIKAAKLGPIMTVEDHIAHTGLGSIVARVLVEESITQRLTMIGVTRYGSSGNPADLYRMQGMDAKSIVSRMREMLV
ncbi:MAG: transketolase [Dissulfurimicrobium sp.]|uniref:transketolase n=1 Tax=Dissulfurimicrobium sp. TaxID=2022436 RepID=UPI0040498FF8